MTDLVSPAVQRTPQSDSQPLVDTFGRVHRSLRISVTDVCNIRCQYCMPESHAEFLPNSRLLSFEQIEAFVRAVAPLGVRNLRLTGGEPLMRPKLHELVDRLAGIPGVDDLALTTNGMLLADQLPKLVAAGLRRLNISLDTLSAATFKTISRRDGFEKVLEGIEAAASYRELDVKLNTLVLRDVNLDDVLALVDFASSRGMALRFIEFMPLDADRAWSHGRMVSGEELRIMIARELGELEPEPKTDLARPSRDFRFVSGRPGRLGFIDSVSSPFCGNCDRLRLTADGKIRNCLFGQQEWDLSPLLAAQRGHAECNEDLIGRVRECVSAKFAAHGIAAPDFQPPTRAMYQIGG